MNTSELGLLAARVAGALHFVQLPATLALVAYVRKRGLTQALPEPVRRILLVLGGGIMLLVLPSGIATGLASSAWLRTPFGCGYLLVWCVFWAYRLLAQVYFYGPLIPCRDRRLHHALSMVFLTKTSCYALALGCFLRLHFTSQVTPVPELTSLLHQSRAVSGDAIFLDKVRGPGRYLACGYKDSCHCF